MFSDFLGNSCRGRDTWQAQDQDHKCLAVNTGNPPPLRTKQGLVTHIHIKSHAAMADRRRSSTMATRMMRRAKTRTSRAWASRWTRPGSCVQQGGWGRCSQVPAGNQGTSPKQSISRWKAFQYDRSGQVPQGQEWVALKSGRNLLVACMITDTIVF